MLVLLICFSAAVAFDDAARRVLYKGDDLVALCRGQHFFFYVVDGLGNVHFLLKNCAVNGLDLKDLFAAETATTQPDGIDARIADGLASHFDEWRNILAHQAAARDHNMPAYF